MIECANRKDDLSRRLKAFEQSEPDMNLLSKFRLLLYLLLSFTVMVFFILGFSIIQYHKSNELGLRDVNPETLAQSFREVDFGSMMPEVVALKVKGAGDVVQEKLTGVWPTIKPYLEFAGIFASEKEGSLTAPKGQAEEKAKKFQEKYDNRYKSVVDLVDGETSSP